MLRSVSIIIIIIIMNPYLPTQLAPHTFLPSFLPSFFPPQVGKEICFVLLGAMKLYPMNAKLQAQALLVMGWACYGHPSAGHYAEEQGAKTLIEAAKNRFPEVTQVHCNATWAGANIWPRDGEAPKQIHQQMENHKKVLAVQYEYF